MVFGNQDEIFQGLEKLRHLLPVQGPIDTFIHHNTLHSFEHLDFEEAVEQASEIYGARPYLPEQRYRDLFLDGTIQREDVEVELAPFLGNAATHPLLPLTLDDFRRNLLYHGLQCEDEAISRWKKSEARLRLRSDLSPRARSSLIEHTRQWLLSLHGAGSEFLAKALNNNDAANPGISNREIAAFIHGSDSSDAGNKRADAFTASILWHCSSISAQRVAVPLAKPAPHHAQALAAITGTDIFDLIHPLMIQLCSMFVDQGVSHWPMPGREDGFLAVVDKLLRQGGIPSEPWVKRAEGLFRKLRPTSMNRHEALAVVLDQLGVPPGERTQFLIHGGLRLKGWAGFISLLEGKPQIARDRPVKASLEEFLVVQNILVLAAVLEIAQAAKIKSVALPTLQLLAQQKSRSRYIENERQRMTQILFQVAQITGISPRVLSAGGADLARTIVDEVGSFPEKTRQRIWHLAYERSYLRSVLVAFGNHKPVSPPAAVSEAQVMFCIDEREESLRRHLEEINPRIETLGYPGFFNLPMAYRGIHHLHAEALCPVVMEPQITVVEHDRRSHTGRRDNLFKRLLSKLSRELQSLTRTPVGGSVISATLGHFALIPFLLRVLQPALAGRFHDTLHTPEIRASDFKIGLTDTAQTDEALRRTIGQGLRAVFEATGIAATAAPLVVIMGHGSSSLNNPHESAHDCGACGGRRGAPSARLFARFANDPLIRAELKNAGVNIPPETYILGAYHDTCDDSITVFDEHMIPEAHRARVKLVIQNCRDASARNALERSRRFLTARRNVSPQRAAASLLHRAEDFSEPRPEYGHATNAMAFIGRRSRCRGLFLDRRAFLSSYDPTQDADGKVLESLLAAVVPVCAGINLEYYFSMVDSTNYGCGTKLPHNIVGQIGVMDGSASDLRTGLPWQMVEIHEPVRLVMLVDTTPQRLAKILENLPKVKNLVEKRWLWLVAHEPDQQKFWLYAKGEFCHYPVAKRTLPRISDSLSYCVHSSKPLPFASVVGANAIQLNG